MDRADKFVILVVIINLFGIIYFAIVGIRHSSCTSPPDNTAVDTLRHKCDSLQIECLRLQNDLYLIEARENALIDSIISSNNNY